MKVKHAVKEAAVIDRTVDALKSCFENVPGARIDAVEREVPVSPDLRIDLLVRMRLGDEERTLLIEAKGTGQPRIAREAIGQLARIRAEDAYSKGYPLFTAPFITERTAEICREAGVGFLDLAGNCRLNMPNLYIERQTSKNPAPEERKGASLFSPKSSRVLRVLLTNHKECWQVQQLAREANVSLGLASRIKTRLVDSEWLSADSCGVRLTEPESLLSSWAQNYDYTANETFQYYSLEDLSQIESSIAAYCIESGVPYALTGFSGARLTAPKVRYNRSMIYVSARIDSVALDNALKPVDTGANVLLMRPYDEGVYYGSEDRYGLRTVSPIQLYLDLRGIPGRGEEAAEELLRKEIRPRW